MSETLRLRALRDDRNECETRKSSRAPMSKIRIDLLLTARGLADSREKAQRLILAGKVLVDDQPVDKPGARVDERSAVRLRGTDSRFVGRGGDKLQGALESFALNVEGRCALDIGASTGGFTDCLLQAGVSHVTAVDVGTAQLHWSLYSDPRVSSHEKTNARYLAADDFPRSVDLIVMDVSFISVTKILPAIARSLRQAERDSRSRTPVILIVLVKPQFELSSKDVGKGGIVRDPQLHRRAVVKVASACRHAGFAVQDLAASAIEGMEGNREFFILAHDASDGPGPSNGLGDEELALKATAVCDNAPPPTKEEPDASNAP